MYCTVYASNLVLMALFTTASMILPLDQDSERSRSVAIEGFMDSSIATGAGLSSINKLV